jgi:hypothetical protein
VTPRIGFADMRALFCPEDLEAMSFVFDLASYEDVCAHAEEIHDRLAERSMPCDTPWPEEDVRRFRAWIDSGMPR